MKSRKSALKSFLRPSLMKVGLWFLFFAIWNYLLQAMRFGAVPCRISEAGILSWSACPLNPVLLDNTLYLGFGVLDSFYIIFYFAVILVGIPYAIACGVVRLYHKLVD